MPTGKYTRYKIEVGKSLSRVYWKEWNTFIYPTDREKEKIGILWSEKSAWTCMLMIYCDLGGAIPRGVLLLGCHGEGVIIPPLWLFTPLVDNGRVL